MKPYVLSPEAAGDLADLWFYIESRSRSEVADRVIAEIQAKIETLCISPGIGHRRKDLSDEDYRYLAVYSYLIVYRHKSKPIEIVSILHGRRDVERILDDRL
jgi:plasmid stabilization system protein ParE